MLLTKKSITVEDVEMGEGMAEIIRIKTARRGEKRRDFAVAYVPPKTNAWNQDEYKKMLGDTGNCLKKILRESKNITLMGDFNCKEVCWEEWSTEGGKDSWGNTLLNLVMSNMMTQWIGENTRFKGDEEASRLDLLFTKELDIIDEVKYQCPLGKSDHLLIEFELSSSIIGNRSENYKSGRYNYRKGDFVNLRKYLAETD